MHKQKHAQTHTITPPLFASMPQVVAVFTELSEVPDLLFAGMPSDPRLYRSLPPYVPRPATTKLINMIGVIVSMLISVVHIRRHSKMAP